MFAHVREVDPAVFIGIWSCMPQAVQATVLRHVSRRVPVCKWQKLQERPYFTNNLTLIQWSRNQNTKIKLVLTIIMNCAVFEFIARLSPFRRVCSLSFLRMTRNVTFAVTYNLHFCTCVATIFFDIRLNFLDGPILWYYLVNYNKSHLLTCVAPGLSAPLYLFAFLPCCSYTLLLILSIFLTF